MYITHQPADSRGPSEIYLADTPHFAVVDSTGMILAVRDNVPASCRIEEIRFIRRDLDDGSRLADLGIQRKLDAVWLDDLRESFELIEVEWDSYHHYKQCNNCFGDGCNQCNEGYIIV